MTIMINFLTKFYYFLSFRSGLGYTVMSMMMFREGFLPPVYWFY